MGVSKLSAKDFFKAN